MFMRQPRDVGDRLQNTGFIIGGHDRYKDRPIGTGEQRLKRHQINHTVGVNRRHDRVIPGEQNGFMFDGRDDRSGAAGTAQHLVVGFGAAADKDNIFRIGIDQRGNAAAGFLDQSACCPTGAMNRRCIAPGPHGFRHGIDDLGPGRGGRVEVEINLGRHDQFADGAVDRLAVFVQAG